jgi:hypothetical protein
MVHYHVHKNLLLDTVLSQVKIATLYPLSLICIIILSFTNACIYQLIYSVSGFLTFLMPFSLT